VRLLTPGVKGSPRRDPAESAGEYRRAVRPGHCALESVVREKAANLASQSDSAARARPISGLLISLSGGIRRRIRWSLCRNSGIRLLIAGCRWRRCQLGSGGGQVRSLLPHHRFQRRNPGRTGSAGNSPAKIQRSRHLGRALDACVSSRTASPQCCRRIATRQIPGAGATRLPPPNLPKAFLRPSRSPRAAPRPPRENSAMCRSRRFTSPRSVCSAARAQGSCQRVERRARSTPGLQSRIISLSLATFPPAQAAFHNSQFRAIIGGSTGFVPVDATSIHHSHVAKPAFSSTFPSAQRRPLAATSSTPNASRGAKKLGYPPTFRLPPWKTQSKSV